MPQALPKAIVDFVKSQPTQPIGELLAGWKFQTKRSFPFQEYIYPMVASLLLSGRVSPTNKDLPNRTDILRWCKASNFNPYLCEWLGEFLVRGKIIECKRELFTRGRQADALDKRDLDACRRAFFHAFTDVIEAKTPRGNYRNTFAGQAGFEEFVLAWTRAFKGLAVPAQALGKIAQGFSKLPREALEKSAELEDGGKIADSIWFDNVGQKAFLAAMEATGGVDVVVDDKKCEWMFVASDLEVMLGLASVKDEEPQSREFVVQSDLTVIAGCDHPLETLASLHRFALVATKGKTLTFKLDAEAIREASARPKSTEAFLKMLQSHQSKLPSTVTSLLAGGSGPDLGKIYIRGCRALIQTETPELLDAIRQHRRLKNFLMSGGPPGYLLIKESSDPWNFIKRCRECGFEIEFPQG